MFTWTFFQSSPRNGVFFCCAEKLPDDLKKDLVNSVQEFLKNNEEVLRYFKYRARAPST